MIYEEANKKNNQYIAMSGAEEASLMKIGTRVVRGPDWKWGDQDAAGAVGTVIADLGDDGWIRVQWNNGETNSYRWSAALGSLEWYTKCIKCVTTNFHS